MSYKFVFFRLCVAVALINLMSQGHFSARAAETFEVGFGKADITPSKPLRLSGYGSRTTVFEGIDNNLYARAMAIRGSNQQLRALVTIDTIGLPRVVTDSIAAQLQEKYSIKRQDLVLSCSHSHTSPHIVPGLSNLFAHPLTDAQGADSLAYTKKLKAQIVAAVDRAMKNLGPAQIAFGEGNVQFARNRRLIAEGSWTGFGVTPAGPTDHSLPILRIRNPDGKLRGVIFNYACHCTTFGGGYNRVNTDWAGYAADVVEHKHPGVTAMCMIGCGGDQNPIRDDDSQRALELAQAHGEEIAAEVERVNSTSLVMLTPPLRTGWGIANLSFELPPVAALQQAASDRSPQTRRHAQSLLAAIDREENLPESYPAPMQVWRFGDDLCMVFMSGEVVIDYVLRLKREVKSNHVWVSAYCNDVFGYLASERVRGEGGYEVDRSMIYYGLPGPWKTGTEEVVVNRIHELVQSLDE